jgi:hypothetical protein
MDLIHLLKKVLNRNMCYEEKPKIDFYESIIIFNISIMITSTFFFNIDKEISYIMIGGLIVSNIILAIWNLLKRHKT